MDKSLISIFKTISAVLAIYVILILWMALSAFLFMFFKIKINFVFDFIVYFIIGASLLRFFNRRNSLFICTYFVIFFKIFSMAYIYLMYFQRGYPLSAFFNIHELSSLFLLFFGLISGVVFRSYIANKRSPKTSLK